MSLFYSAGLGAAAIPDSAVSQFKGDEGSGSTLTNEYAGQPDATINSSTWASVADLVGGYGLDHDGTDDYESIGSSFGFVDLTSPFTFCVTVNLNDLSADQNIWHTGDGSNYAFAVGTSASQSGNLAAIIREGGGTKTVNGTSNGTSSRLRLGVGFDPTTPSIDVALDGTIQSDESVNGPRSDESNNNNVLGVRDSSNYFMDGILDNPIWYNEVLTDAQFSQDYDAQPWS